MAGYLSRTEPIISKAGLGTRIEILVDSPHYTEIGGFIDTHEPDIANIFFGSPESDARPYKRIKGNWTQLDSEGQPTDRTLPLGCYGDQLLTELHQARPTKDKTQSLAQKLYNAVTGLFQKT